MLQLDIRRQPWHTTGNFLVSIRRADSVCAWTEIRFSGTLGCIFFAY